MSNLSSVIPGILKKATKRLCSSVVRSADYQIVYLNHFLKFVDLDAKSLMIVGLGQGLEVPCFLDKGCSKVIAIEPFPIIEESQFGPRFELVVTGGESIPVEDNYFDHVYSIASLEHMANPLSVVREMVRVLKPGGVLYCSGGPFWFSAYGYHKKEKYPLLTEPWFHVAYTKEEYLQKHPEIAKNAKHLKRINQIYDHPGYNRLPSQIYYDITAELLRDNLPLDISVQILSENMLNKSTCRDKLLSSYSKRDLLTEGFTFVMRKS